MYNIPFYWPTKTIILDDDRMFLAEMKELLGQSNRYIFLTDPKDAIKYLDNSKISFDWYINNPVALNSKTAQYDIDYESIQLIRNKVARFDLVSTIIVDYHMPEMSGIDFCKYLDNNKYLRKTLLTSNTDYQQAVKYLNQQIINSFIDKRDINQENLFKDHIKEEEYKYFLKRGRFILEAISLNNPTHPLLSFEYHEIISNIITKYSIQECYLIDHSGIYLMLDNQSTEYLIYLYSEDDINEMASEAEDNSLEKEVCYFLKNKKKALCYYNQGLAWPNYEYWAAYLFPVQKFVIGNDDYYYSVVRKN